MQQEIISFQSCYSGIGYLKKNIFITGNDGMSKKMVSLSHRTEWKNS